jgi:hypothetical protein
VAALEALFRRHYGLLDHLIRAEEQHWGHREAEGFRRPQIDDQLELHGLLHCNAHDPSAPALASLVGHFDTFPTSGRGSGTNPSRFGILT